MRRISKYAETVLERMYSANDAHVDYSRREGRFMLMLDGQADQIILGKTVTALAASGYLMRERDIEPPRYSLTKRGRERAGNNQGEM